MFSTSLSPIENAGEGLRASLLLHRARYAVKNVLWAPRSEDHGGVLGRTRRRDLNRHQRRLGLLQHRWEEEKGCEGRRLGLIGAKELSRGKSCRNREGKHGLSSSPARPREEERGKGEGVADVRAWRVSDREKRDPAVCEKKEREGEVGCCGVACAMELDQALASSWSRGESGPRGERGRGVGFGPG